MKLSKNWGRLVMKSNWKECNLGDLCDITSSKRIFAKEYCSSGVAFYRGKEIIQKSKREHISTELYISEERYNEIKKKFGVPINEDILMTAVGTLGVPYIVGNEKFYFKDGNLVWFRNFKNILPLYMYYWLKAPYAQNQIHINSIGSTQKAITIDALRKFNILLPSLEEQKKIASILSALDDKIEVNQKINENLEQQAQAIFKNLLDNLNDCDIVSLDDMAIICNKTFNPSKEKETMLEHYSIPSYDDSKFPIFELSTNIKSNKFIIDKDCFLISKLNPTTKRVWKPYCISNKSVCSTEFIVYKAKNVIFTDYLYSLIDSDIFSEFMCSHVTGSTGSRQRTTPSETLKFKFKIPKTDDLLKFNSIVSPIYKQIMNNAIQNDRLKNIRDTLLPKLMNGEIIV